MMKWFIIGVPVLALTLFGFQNCGAQHRSELSSMSLPLDHPDVQASETLEGRIVLGDHQYLVSVFQDLLSGTSASANDYGSLQNILNYEFNPVLHLLGRSCNPYEAGDFCGGEATSASIPMTAYSSTGREASRIQVCRWIANDDALLGRIRDKVMGRDPTPNWDSMRSMVEIFYPAGDDGVLDQTASKLMDLDGEMTRANELVINRWRLMFLSVCETPGWEAI